MHPSLERPLHGERPRGAPQGPLPACWYGHMPTHSTHPGHLVQPSPRKGFGCHVTGARSEANANTRPAVNRNDLYDIHPTASLSPKIAGQCLSADTAQTVDGPGRNTLLFPPGSRRPISYRRARDPHRLHRDWFSGPNQPPNCCSCFFFCTEILRAK